MSRKDYERFVEMIKYIDYLTLQQKEMLANDIAGLFQSNNGSFNKGRFINACEISKRALDKKSIPPTPLDEL